MSKEKQRIVYIDATPILNDKLSGVGHLTLMTIKQLIAWNASSYSYEIRLLVPARKAHFVDYWGLGKEVRVVQIPLLARVWNTWPRLPFMPPIDLFFGKGVYIFPNFKRWPLARSRSITYIHDISFKLFPQFTEHKNLSMLLANVGRWMQKTDVIVTDSKASKKEIVDTYTIAKDKVKVIYCGIDTNFYKKTSNAQIDSLRNQYGLSEKYFMFLSSIEPRKNIERLLEGLQKLPSTYRSGYSLIMVGGMGWNNEDIIKKISLLRHEGWNIVVPSKYVPDDDVAVLLSGAQLLIHPALHEGFGIPPLEAMSCGVPVVVSDIPVMREVCGDAAAYANPYDTDDIASKINSVSTDNKLRKKLINAGYERVTRFAPENIAESLNKIVNDQFRGMV